MTMTKPCARAPRGCLGIIEAPGPKTLAKREFCSGSCAVRARLEAGWHPDRALTRDQRRRGGQQGGKVAGMRRRRQALMGAVLKLGKFLTPEFLEGLSAAQEARVRVLLGRAYRIGHRRGYRAGCAARKLQPQRRKVA
jgi:hypothetical protein